ncbi:hypothetical protein Ciccas_007018 [Cichlidogyrus casuarinus]|uniref:Uncharacterized protein n=1 Tax=Cichlidogyrus casuarinus TaxID=1844966 RepID=A0ABD2Q6L8_9PLAT
MKAFKPLFYPINPESQYDFNVHPQPSSLNSTNYVDKDSMAFYFNSNTSKYPTVPVNSRKHQLNDDSNEPPAVKKYLSEQEMSAHFSSMNINLQGMSASKPDRMEPLYIDSTPPSKLVIEEIDDEGNPIRYFEHMDDETFTSYTGL